MASLSLLLFDLHNLISAEGATFLQVGLYTRFSYNSLHNSAWKKAWRAAGLPVCDEYTRGPHNLKHTFGHRLRVAGVSLETRKKLLHHSNGDITTHYSPASVAELLEAVEKTVNLKPVSILRRVI